MMRLAKAAFGLLSVLIGVAILLWRAYSLFVPNQYFRWRSIEIPRLAVSIVMMWFGWHWISGSVVKRQKYASELTVTVKLSGPDFGMQPERNSILDLKHWLETKLIAEGLGEIDGEEFGDAECSLFVRTNAPVEAERSIRSFLTSEAPSLTYSVSTSEV